VTRARVLRLLGRLAEARKQLVEVLANAPGYASAQRELDLVDQLEKQKTP
jgi:hypothetical protein